MRKNALLPGAVSALALLLGSTGAFAAAPTTPMATISGDYSSTDAGGADADTWGANGAAAFGLGMNDLGAEVNASYHSADQGGADLDTFSLGGSLFWAPAMGRAGVSLSYTSFEFGGTASGLDADAFTYGLFGEYFASDFFTLGAKGGGLNLDATLGSLSGDESGYYVGAFATAYAMPNLALNASIDYGDIDAVNVTSYGVGAEYMFSEMVPVALFGGYTKTDISSGGGDADTWFVGVKFYMGGPPASLVTRQRTGTLGPVGNITGLNFAF